ncbi:MAG: SAM-dependent chlorinase/fluorinase [Candidatus Omnitrophica bacterium]|nr:SAM-dependent chlorinase/fluorinase [Candidatus Omnitrophota bacterium]
MNAGRGLVALLTDFGTRDWYVAALKGVIASRAPRARFIDITHEIPPQDVVAGAFTLAAAVPWFPTGTVVVAVVDPGVGTDRPVLAAQADGRFLVGPDNGLLGLALAQAARRRVVRLTQRRYWLPTISRTFQGRDIMAPVAAYLARGGVLSRLGPAHRAAALALPPAVRRRRTVVGRIVHIDGFGNLITNLRADRWLPARRKMGAAPFFQTAPARLVCRRRSAPMVSSYAKGPPRRPVAVVGALGLMEVAVRNGSAARLLGARRGDRVTLQLPRP